MCVCVCIYYHGGFQELLDRGRTFGHTGSEAYTIQEKS